MQSLNVRSSSRPCRFALVLLITLTVLALPGLAPASAQDESPGTSAAASPLGQALQSRLGSGTAAAPVLESLPGATRERIAKAAQRFYDERGYRTVWLSDGRPTGRVDELLGGIDGVTADGLSPETYRPDALRRLVQEANGGTDAAARAELALSQTFLTLVEHLGSGRLDPDRASTPWYIENPSPDLAAILAEVAGGAGVQPTLEAARPVHDGYERLRRGLERYRQLADAGGWPQVPEGAVLEPGDTAPRERIEALVGRLQPEGFLPEGYTPPAPEGAAADGSGELLYDDRLSDAVGRFQERYGIVVDGLVGPETRGAMNLSAAERVERIAINLERWRWLPDDLGQRHVRVDVPGFEARAYENGEPALSMKVVVGKEGAGTPSFSDRMTHAIINPYWNVPHSITVSEILPQARQDPGYLAANDFEIVTGWGNDAEVVGASATAFANLESGEWRIRERPGPGNALGQIKFMFPNEHNIYLHDTPAEQLFEEDVRAFSHGCIRLERPFELGGWLFAPSSEWTESRLRQAVESGERQRADLPEEVPVYLLYWTARAGEDGTVSFRKDLYGHDETLAAELGVG